ncbi:hypothetical protein K502DRAFT_344246 [Neoconidiobolus thromboides FSU 785]|nr:hypothetical protein K502DRAFT_344246 [Neoconidiobolus thromboides FSU 785]
MGQVSRSIGVLSGIVFSTGFIYAFRKNIERDIHSQTERLKDVDYLLNTSFLPEAKRAEIEDQRPVYREVLAKPYVLELVEGAKSHAQKELIPEIKSQWNGKLYQFASALNNIEIDVKNWSFKW